MYVQMLFEKLQTDLHQDAIASLAEDGCALGLSPATQPNDDDDDAIFY